MIHSFLIISAKGGLVLYQKQLIRGVRQPGLIGGLITALTEFTSHTLQSTLSYIEMSHVAMSLAECNTVISKVEQKVICALFHDVADGEICGKLLASELLQLFLDEYRAKLVHLKLAGAERIEEIFKNFSTKIFLGIENSLKPIMRFLEQNPEIKQVTLVRDIRFSGNPTYLEGVLYNSGKVPTASMAANLQNLLNLSDDLLSVRHEYSKLITIGDKIVIRRVQKAILVLVFREPHKDMINNEDVDLAIGLLEKIFKLLENIQGSGC